MHESVYVYALLCVSMNGHRHVCRCVHTCVLVYTCDSMPSGSCADVLWVYVNVCVCVRVYMFLNMCRWCVDMLGTCVHVCA